MSGQPKNAEKSDWKQIVNFLFMVKMGGINSPQFHFLTTFVCGQQIDIDTDFLLCVIQQQTKGSISQ